MNLRLKNTLLFLLYFITLSTGSILDASTVAKDDDLVCVHYTKIKPRNYLIPGSVPTIPNSNFTINEILVFIKDCFTLRPSIHSVLNSWVEAHDASGFTTQHENYPYAVIIPYKKIIDQLYGGYHQDIITIGPIGLDEDSIILVQNGVTDIPESSSAKVEILSSDIKNMKNGVISFLLRNKKPLITPSPIYLTKENFKKVISEMPDDTFNKYLNIFKSDSIEVSKSKTISKLTKSISFSPIQLSTEQLLETIGVSGVWFNANHYLHNQKTHHKWIFGKHLSTVLGKLEEKIGNIFYGIILALIYSALDEKMN